MSLRIGFDMDGVLADFASAFRELEGRLFPATGGSPRRGGEAQGADPTAASPARARQDAVWQAIQGTPDFWTTLEPIHPDAVRRIHQQTLKHRWEVFFITQRPATEGETVQRQTQRWLMRHGFDVPSVLVIKGSRGAAAGALELNYHVDDSPQNCLDVIADARAKPILVLGSGDAAKARKARSLGIGVAQTIEECLDILEQVSVGRGYPRILQKLAETVGWR